MFGAEEINFGVVLVAFPSCEGALYSLTIIINTWVIVVN